VLEASAGGEWAHLHIEVSMKGLLVVLVALDLFRLFLPLERLVPVAQRHTAQDPKAQPTNVVETGVSQQGVNGGWADLAATEASRLAIFSSFGRSVTSSAHDPASALWR